MSDGEKAKQATEDRQPAETPCTADQWARDKLTGLYTYHRRGWLRSVRDRGMLQTYQAGSAWQTDFEAWCQRPVTR